MKVIFTFLFLLCTAPAMAGIPGPEALGWKAYTIDSKTLGEVHYFVTSNNIDAQKPVLLYLDGSGALPLFQCMKDGNGSNVLLNYKKLSAQYHIVIISKPGVPFIDSVAFNEEMGFPEYPVSAEYKKRLSLQWRVTAADVVLQDVLQNLKTDKRRIAIMGISEGFQVGAKLLTQNKAITHAVLLVGNGLSQLYDFIIQVRTDAQAGRITYAEAETQIAALHAAFKDIYAHPTATDKEWYGHTYLRWASFSNNIPVENLMEVSIPVYVVAAADDHNTSAISADYIALEALRRGKTNITYKVYPYNHFFQESLKDDSGNITGTKDHMAEVVSEAMKWLEE